MNDNRLKRSKELQDFRVSEKDPDVRGWDVYGSDGQKFGVVDDVVVDVKDRNLRYIQVKLTSEVSPTDRNILVPVGIANLHDSDNEVHIKSYDKQTIKKYPEYTGEDVSREYETTLRRALLPETTETSDEDFYEHEHFDEHRFYGKRRVHKLYRSKDLGKYKENLVRPDVKGWNVYDEDGNKLGKVDEVIADPYMERVRYLEVELKDNDRHVLVPLGAAKMKEKDDDLVLHKFRTDTLHKMPEYKGDFVTRDYEIEMSKVYNPDKTFSDKPGEAEFYDEEYFSEGRFYGDRTKPGIKEYPGRKSDDFSGI